MTKNITTFVHIGDLVKLIDFEPNKLKCDNWNYADLIDKELTGTIEEIQYGTNPLKEKTKTCITLILDDDNASKISIFKHYERDENNQVKTIINHRAINLTNPIFELIEPTDKNPNYEYYIAMLKELATSLNLTEDHFHLGGDVENIIMELKSIKGDE